MYFNIIKFIKKNILKNKIIQIVHSFYLALKIEKKLLTQKKIVIVYDCKNTPPTFGDFSYYIFLMRFIISKKKKVKLIIINSEFRKDWDVINPEKRKMFIRELVNLADYYVSKNTVSIMNWPKFEVFYKKNSSEIILFEKIKKRQKIYNKIFNTLQILYFFNKKLWNSILVDYDKKKYFALHLRYQAKSKYHVTQYNVSQNIKFEEAEKLVSILINQHPNLNCIIFTDSAGMNHFKFLKKISNRIKFSKELSPSFLEDIKLLCQCQYYYAYKGGGMGVFPKFSDIKFCIAQQKLGNEFSWNKKNNQIASWNNIDQKFFVDKNLTIDKYINSIKLFNSN